MVQITLATNAARTQVLAETSTTLQILINDNKIDTNDEVEDLTSKLDERGY